MKSQYTLSIAFILLISCTSGEPAVQNAAIDVPTVQCETCKKNIETALTGLRGMESAEVDLNKKQIRITYRPSVLSLDTIELTITSLGYQANKKKADADAYRRLAPCCKGIAKYPPSKSSAESLSCLGILKRTENVSKFPWTADLTNERPSSNGNTSSNASKSPRPKRARTTSPKAPTSTYLWISFPSLSPDPSKLLG